VTLTEFIERLEKRVAEAVAEEARLIASEIRSKTPATRKKTRQAIKSRSQGTRAKVGIYFAQRYAGNDTTTHENFKRHWREIRPKAKKRLIARLNNIINGK
jgi:capsid protein